MSINASDNQPNEPTIAIDPTDPYHIVAGSNLKNKYESFDGGETWYETQFSSEYGFYGDPVLHFTKSGELFIAHLPKTPGKTYGEWFDRIVVDKLEPGIKSYSVGFNEPKMQDKPWLSSDDYSEEHKGNLYVTWSQFDQYDSDDPAHRSRIMFSKLTPSSQEFSETLVISDITGDCKDGDSTLEGATSAVGTNGEIYVAWAGLNKIYFDASHDGGKTFGTDRVVTEQVEGWEMDMPNIFRANGMPFIACSKETNNIFITWADEHDGNADIWLAYSRDRGNTWSDRIKLNKDNSFSHQYFPNIAIDDKTGKVYVAFYDQRHSNKNLFYDIYLAEFDITNPENIKNFRLSPQSIALPGEKFFYGDYLDIDIVEGQLAVAYSSFEFPSSSSIDIALGPLSELGKASHVVPTSITLHDNKDSTQLYINVQTPVEVIAKVKGKKRVNSLTKKMSATGKNWHSNYDYLLAEFDRKEVKKIRVVAKNKNQKFKYKKTIKLK